MLRVSSRRRDGRARMSEAGFTLIETVLAMAIFIGVATSLAGVLTSSIAAHTVARERTLAEQIANGEMESIRRLPYAQVGVVGGNPGGTVVATRTVTQDGLIATVTDQISYVNDPTPTSYATGANYKKATVTVTRARDGKVLTRVVTNIAPPARAPFGGINNAILNVQAVDYALNTPVPGASVTIDNGPDPTRTDTTDTTGSVSFAALTPNPPTGPTAYYDITVALTGYVTLDSDVPPAAAAHVQLSPSQTLNTAIRIFKPATIIVQMTNADGTPYTGTSTVKVTSARTGTTDTIVVQGGSATLTTFDGGPIVPGVSYTVKGLAANGTCADPAPRYVPDDYPTVLTSTFTLVYGPCASGRLAVNVKQSGADVPGATVDVTGGPNGMSLTGTTDANGDASFDVPAGPGYTVTATKSGASASRTVTAVLGATTPVAITLPSGPPGSLAVYASWDGPLGACSGCVTLTGGPDAISVTGSTDAGGRVTFVNVPAGSGYTVTVRKNGIAGSSPATVTAGATANVTVSLPVGTVNATVRYGTLPATGAAITVTGGPNAISITGTTTGSGTYSDSIPAGNSSTYTITASKAGRSVSTTFTLPADGSVANVTLAMPVRTTLTVRVEDGDGDPSPGASVTITGGPENVANSGTANGSGRVSFTNVPAGSTPYTLKAWNCSAPTGDKSRTRSWTVTPGGTQTVTLQFDSRTCPP